MTTLCEKKRGLHEPEGEVEERCTSLYRLVLLHPHVMLLAVVQNGHLFRRVWAAVAEDGERASSVG